MKIDDNHRRIFPTGDWTDDTDQMILIMQSITQQKGNVRNIWDKVFKNGPNKVCRRQSLKNLKGYGLLKQTISLQFFKGCLQQVLLGPFLNTLSHLKVGLFLEFY